MINFTCPGCNSRLKAKPTMAGRTRPCPKCGRLVVVPGEAKVQTPAATAPAASATTVPPETTPPAGPAEPQRPVAAAEDQAAPPAQAQPDRSAPLPARRLNRHAWYLVCGQAKLIALWEPDGLGWRVAVGAGLKPAAREADKLPNQGDFKLIELLLEPTEAGHRLSGIIVHQLASRWALVSLAKAEDQILQRITGPGTLSREQKILVRSVLREHFMHDVWAGADEVLAFLSTG